MGRYVSFIDDSRKVHGDKYDYKYSMCYKKSQKVPIICPTHGIFNQVVSRHVNGFGCAKCKGSESFQKKIENPIEDDFHNWVKESKRSKNFDSFKFYIASCKNKTESFIKVGKTFRAASQRIGDIPYSSELIYVFEGTAEEVSKKESEFISKNLEHIYTPMKKFGGCRECFSSIVTKNLKI